VLKALLPGRSEGQGLAVAFSNSVVNCDIWSIDVEKAMNILSDWADKLCAGIFSYDAVWDEVNELTHQLKASDSVVGY
jgi:hypothetical protein